MNKLNILTYIVFFSILYVSLMQERRLIFGCDDTLKGLLRFRVPCANRDSASVQNIINSNESQKQITKQTVYWRRCFLSATIIVFFLSLIINLREIKLFFTSVLITALVLYYIMNFYDHHYYEVIYNNISCN